MKLLYTNAQSVIKKMDELRALVDEKKPDVVALTETWTNNDIPNEFLHINGYEILEREDRVDTSRGRGGGILVYVKKGLCAWKENVDGDFCQCVCVKLKGRSDDLSIFVTYRSPNSTRENDELLCALMNQMRGRFVAVGDFNFPGIKWATGGSDARGRSFYDTLDDNFMTQHVEEATHISGNILDLVIGSDANIVQELRMEGRLATSDHELIEVNVILETNKIQAHDLLRDYGKGDYREMRRRVSCIPWERELECRDVEESWSFLKHVLEDMTENLVPLKKKRNNRSPPWMNGEVKRAIREKRKAWNKWKRTKEEEEKSEYKQWEKRTKKLIRNRKNGFERQVAKECKINPKRFYSYINSSRRSHSTIGPLHKDGERVVDPKEQAEFFNEYFSSVFTRCNDELPSKEQYGMTEISDVVINEKIIIEEIGRIREYSAPGPDKVANKIIIELQNELAKPLATLFRKSLDNSRIPDDWRLSNVTPIFKKGSKSDPGNYRPVSLTSNVCKLMERVINATLGVYLNKSVLENTQHGFRKGRSCQTNLIEFNDKVGEWLDEGKCVDVLYLDFAKAFDKVDHERLMVKLAAVGVKGKLWAWIKDWLANRHQRVVVNGEASEWLPVESGTPQGTVLAGPLFTVYVKDMDEAIRAFLRKFADDTKLARIIDNCNDAKLFQEDIDSLVEWAIKWAMVFNESKCKIMHLGRNNPKTVYTMNGVTLAETEEERDLGVVVSSTFKQSVQCETAAKKANQVLGLINRSFHYRTKESLVPLYKCLVRPKLEFAAAAWNPYLEKDIESLEKVQRRLIRSLSNVRGTTYDEKLKDAGLTSLRNRRERGDLIETYKTLNGFNNVDKHGWFDIPEEDPTRSSTRSTTTIGNNGETENRVSLIRERARTGLRNQSFRFRAARAWNELPDFVRKANSVNGFKNAFDAWKRGENQNQSL